MFRRSAFWGATMLAPLLAFGGMAFAQEMTTSKFEISVGYSGPPSIPQMAMNSGQETAAPDL
jgi:hypothetical protein